MGSWTPPVMPAPARLMSLFIISIAARMFCWVSARCDTTNVAFMQVLNKLVAAPSTMRPTDMAIVSSSSENPGCVFCFRMFMVFKFELFAFSLFVFELRERGDQGLDCEGLGARASVLGVGDTHDNLFQFGIDGDAVRFKNLVDLDRAGESLQAQGGVVGGAEDAVGAGKNQALWTRRAGPAGGVGRVIRGVDQTVGTSVQHLRGTDGENSSAANVGNLREGDLLSVARSVDALHGLQSFLAGDEIILRVLSRAHGGAKPTNDGNDADGQDDGGNHDLDQREAALRGMSRR